MSLNNINPISVTSPLLKKMIPFIMSINQAEMIKKKVG